MNKICWPQAPQTRTTLLSLGVWGCHVTISSVGPTKGGIGDESHADAGSHRLQ